MWYAAEQVVCYWFPWYRLPVIHNHTKCTSTEVDYGLLPEQSPLSGSKREHELRQGSWGRPYQLESPIGIRETNHFSQEQ
jgi:hypothetical protein